MPTLWLFPVLVALSFTSAVSQAQPIVWEDPIGPNMGAARLVEHVGGGALVGAYGDGLYDQRGLFAGNRLVTGQFFAPEGSRPHLDVEALIANGETVYGLAPILCACECACASYAVSRSFDGGTTWEFVDESLEIQPFFSLRDLAAGRSQEWYALGGPAQLSRSTDDGRTWTPVASLALGEGERLYTLAANDDGAVAVVATINNGEVTIVYRSSNGGATWQRYASTPPAVPVMVRFGGDVLYGVGQVEGREESVVLRNEPGSAEWTAKPMPVFQPYYGPGGYMSVRMPYEPEDGLLWTEAGLFRETEEGWTREVLPGVDLGPIPVADVAVRRQAGVFIEGYAATADGVLAWNAAGVRAYPVAPFTAVNRLGTGASRTLAWVTGSIVDDQRRSMLFEYTRKDGAATWTRLLEGPGFGQAIEVAPDGTAYATTGGAAYRLDGEGTVQLDPPGSITNLEATAEGHLFVAAGDGVYVSEDRGETYTLVGFEEERVRDIALAADGRRYVVTSVAPQLYRQAEDGTWTSVLAEPVYAVAASESALFAANDEVVRRSLDGGDTWETVLEYAPPYQVSYIILSARGTLVGVSARGQFYVSRDQGDTWEVPARPWTAVIGESAIAFDEEGVAFIGTRGAGVYRSAESLVVAWEDDRAVPRAVHLDPVYPNPLVDRATVSFSLAEAGPVSVQVYDALGRYVAVLADEARSAGGHTVAWTPRSGLASGVYLVRLVTPSGTATQRIAVVGR
ncbi:MAG: T9SS type A sorting domain-containing protein [Bacteroidota bacterium]